MGTNLLHLSSIIAIFMACSHGVSAIPLSDFYPFGSQTSDFTLPPNDDGFAGPILLTLPFPFFDEDQDTVFVNNNGAISFTAGVTQFTPDPFPLSLELIAPFWADVDTRGTGTVWYRETTEPQLLSRARNEIQTAFLNQGSFLPTILFIATWDHVGYYSFQTIKTNTFQCVMATDGVRSFVVFLYAEGEVQWTTGGASGGTGGLGGIPAQVGFNAGDRIRFTTVPGSRTDAIINIAQTSNVALPGMWIFRIDGKEIAVGGCTSESNVVLTVAPRAGHILGGTVVEVMGPCLEETDSITCVFDGQEVNGVIATMAIAVCVSPPLSSLGKVPFQLIVRSSSGDIRAQGEGDFFSLDYDDGVRVEYDPDQAVFHPGDNVKLTWFPDSIVSVLDPDTYMVDVGLYCLNETTKEWDFVAILASDLRNDGSAVVTMPNSTSIPVVCPITIQIAAAQAVGVSVLRRELNPEEILKHIGRPAKWGFIRYRVATSFTRRSLCELWCSVEPENTGEILLNEVEPCPPTEGQAERDSRFKKENKKNSDIFHPGTSSCFRQIVNSEECQPGSQCCYGKGDKKLIIGPPSGGTIDLVSPQGKVNTVKHFLYDVLPYIYCCTGLFPNCDAYYKKRPSKDNSTEYVFPIPAAARGDPHLVSLDGIQFTFNGRGEYILIDTTDAKFTLQGRMVSAENDIGDPVPATALSAIAAGQNGSNTVQFEISRLGIRALVKGQEVNFDGVPEQQFNNVILQDKGNHTLSARFSSGAYLEVTEENDIISVLLVSLPDNFQMKTFGLMGNFNGNRSDDLLPRGSTRPLAPNATVQEIHEKFGLTWIVNSTAESLFTYGIGEDFEDFFDPSYVPAFGAVFSDATLEAEAQAVCGEDEFCLYDIATTGRIEIGLSTATAVRDFEELIMLSQPIVCDPPCVNGACVANDTCNCATDFEGPQCTDQVYTECLENPCKNGGTCQFHAGSFLCTCAPGFTGSLCQTNRQGENIRLVNDTLIGEPLMTVPIYVQSSIQQQFLCYEIHGSADDYFNLVSDQCTTVNAHYASANLHPEITIIDAITVRAVDSTQECQNIRVNLNQCAAFLGDTPLNISPRGVTVNRISVRRFRNRVRISVPNCNDSSLVMWVFCTTGSLADPASDDVFSQDMIKFVISRGLNLNERSHGLLGQFWNIPISVEQSTARYRDGGGLGDALVVSVSHPDDKTRSFVVIPEPYTWDLQRIVCLYGGNQQGGPIYEVETPNDPVIQGVYLEYKVRSAFATDFAYSHFDESMCN